MLQHYFSVKAEFAGIRLSMKIFLILTCVITFLLGSFIKFEFWNKVKNCSYDYGGTHRPIKLPLI